MNCPECGSAGHVVKAGFHVTRKGRSQKMKCQRCGLTFQPKEK